MKLWHLKLERHWFVSAPESMEEEEILEIAYPEFINFDLKDIVQVNYWGNPADLAFEPDYEIEGTKNE